MFRSGIFVSSRKTKNPTVFGDFWRWGDRSLARIILQGITKNFGNTPVLNGVDLEIADGEFLTLLGPSGCGKTTLLRIIAGLEPQTAGNVEIDGTVVNQVRPSRRDLAMVFQTYALYPHLTVRENLTTPLLLRDLGFWERFPLIGPLIPGSRAKREILTAVVQEAAETLEIKHLLERKPGQLSGGQQQRVALGRAMVRKPAAFLMDEPLSNLDAALRVHMRAELVGLHRTLGTTFIYVTHDQAEALTMSDRMAVIMEGNLLQVGAPNEIYENPQDRRVAEFVGSPKINFLPGEGDSSGRLSCLGVALKRRLERPANGSFSVGLRPEHLELRPRNSSGCFVGKINYMENLGSDIHLHIALIDGANNIVARVKPSEAQDAAIGDELWIGLDHGKAMAFGADGQRLALIGERKSDQVA